MSQELGSEKTSIHSAGIEKVHIMPISEINRPIQSILDPEKVDSIANALQNDPLAVPPLDVNWIMMRLMKKFLMYQ